MEKQMSAASLRAANYPKDNKDWFCQFKYDEAYGLGFEPGVHRRDPSSVLIVDDVYYVWYTKSTGRAFHGSSQDIFTKRFPWDYSDVWYATSKDGVHWDEQGCAIARGGEGSCDERTVCTPDVSFIDGKYYCVYQTQRQGIMYSGSGEGVGMAYADNANGPWTKIEGNILEPMDVGYWFGEDCDDYNRGKFTGRVHDPMLMKVNGKYHLYYKCGSSRADISQKCAGWDTRTGVAVADSPTGPFEHHPMNPITNSGHETMLWQYKGGVCALLNRDGPEKNTIQYAKDGINFEIMSYVSDTPWAAGLVRTKCPDRTPLEGLRWGLCHKDEGFSEWSYILRFDIDTM